MTRRRVLVSAYAVSPVRGSEPGMGWNICLGLARHHDVTVLCSPGVPPGEQDFRAEIEAHRKAHGSIPGLTFHFVPPPPLSYLLQRETPWLRRTLYYVGYRSWQRAALRSARALHQRAPFDLVHQLNITSFREPGYLWTLPDVPFVWGPVGGAANLPRPFLPMMSRRERGFYQVRNLLNTIQQHTLRRCRHAARRASHIWAIGEDNYKLVSGTWGAAAERMLEVGGEPHPAARLRTYDGDRPLRLVWSGRHLGRKALPLLLHALAALRGEPAVALTVLGDGPESAAWQAQAQALGVAPLVTWAGQVTREEALAVMADADAFVSTSVLEETSLVVLEALSLGLPVICHDAGGMREAVTPACGITVALQSPAASIAGYEAAVRTLACGGERFAQLSFNALARSRELGWDHKAAAMAAVYDRVVTAAAAACRQDRPPAIARRSSPHPARRST